jgi:DNA-nicking Smr family endonuclease
MSDSNDLDKDEISLFRQSIGTVRPIRQNSVITLPEKPKPWPSQRVADERQTLEDMATGFSDNEYLETGEELAFKRDGIQSRLFQKLKRGQLKIENVLDLHGMTIALAKAELSQFLAEARATNRRCIRIIHGKGKGSKQGIPVLKRKLNHWLQQRDDVLAFCSARVIDGGTGAVYVLIRKNKGIN